MHGTDVLRMITDEESGLAEQADIVLVEMGNIGGLLLVPNYLDALLRVYDMVVERDIATVSGIILTCSVAIMGRTIASLSPNIRMGFHKTSERLMRELLSLPKVIFTQAAGNASPVC